MSVALVVQLTCNSSVSPFPEAPAKLCVVFSSRASINVLLIRDTANKTIFEHRSNWLDFVMIMQKM